MMHIHWVTLSIPLPVISSSLVAGWMMPGCLTLLVWFVCSMHRTDTGFTKFIEGCSAVRGLVWVAAVMLAWPLFIALQVFVLWYEISGRAKALEERRERQRQEQLDRFMSNN